MVRFRLIRGREKEQREWEREREEQVETRTLGGGLVMQGIQANGKTLHHRQGPYLLLMRGDCG